MADQEVIKHTKKVLSVMTHKEHSLGAKLREIALEVAVIVFAVSTSIWLHGVSEHRHEQEKVKTFLLGLKNDLLTNTESLKKESKFVRERRDVLAYLAALDPAASPDRAVFDAAMNKLMYPRFGVFLQAGRYESFKSSGRLMNIENEKLLQDIVFEFETGVRAIQGGEALTRDMYGNFRSYIDEGIDAGVDPIKLVTAPKGKRLLNAMAATVLEDYRVMGERQDAMVRQIDVLFPDEAVKALPSPPTSPAAAAP
jgi:hypothetical protein